MDDDPAGQYLLPEFMLYRRLLEQAGHGYSIADAADARDRGRRTHDRGRDGRPGLQPLHRLLPRGRGTRPCAKPTAQPRGAHTPPGGACPLGRQAGAGLVARDALLRLAGLEDGDRPTSRNDSAHRGGRGRGGDELWARRKDLFFKPAAGYGGKAAYRGDKLTRKAFEHVLAHRYVAQAVAPTSSRRVPLEEGDGVDLRVDVRNFADGGRRGCARPAYRGQTTNFRTAGGGFAPVLTVPDSTQR